MTVLYRCRVLSRAAPEQCVPWGCAVLAARRMAAYDSNHSRMRILDSFHPAVAAWFARTHPAPTEAQAQAWPAIQAGRDVLVAAPTGSGKTLAAFLAAIDQLVKEGSSGGLPDETRVLYVSPLKALSN